MKSSMDSVAITVGMLLICISFLEDSHWVAVCYADGCNYAIQAANPNPCEYDPLTAVLCKHVFPCQDGLTTQLAPHASCGGSVIFGTGETLMQPNPNGGNAKSKSVPDIECGKKYPCIVSVCFRGTCVNGSATMDVTGTVTTYARECCEGGIQQSTPVYVHQAGQESCPEG